MYTPIILLHYNSLARKPRESRVKLEITPFPLSSQECLTKSAHRETVGREGEEKRQRQPVSVSGHKDFLNMILIHFLQADK